MATATQHEYNATPILHVLLVCATPPSAVRCPDSLKRGPRATRFTHRLASLTSSCDGRCAPLVCAKRTQAHARAKMCAVGGSDLRKLDALLRKHQLDITSEEVLDQLDSAFATIPAAGAAPLSMDEVQFLRAHAGTGAAAVVDDWSDEQERQAHARAAVRELADTLSGSMSIKEAATLLEIDPSRVSRRITAKRLWAFDINGSRRIPRWQLLDRDLLPGLDAIVPAIPRDTTPTAVEAFMKAPQPDFGNRTPIEHLAAGGDPTLIADFVSDLARW